MRSSLEWDGTEYPRFGTKASDRSMLGIVGPKLPGICVNVHQIQET